MKNSIGDITIGSDLHGLYRGIVEDNKDPEKLCRCKIRVIGIHSDLKINDSYNGIPTNELPWAEPVMGLSEGSVSSNGLWSVPLQGSHVFLFFEAGNMMQPRFFGSAPAKPNKQPDITKGFSDPDGIYPKEDQLNESDVSRLARNENIEKTIVKSKNDNIDIGVEIAQGGTWDEQPSSYATEYPHNTVFETHGGIVVEIDSTPNEERVHIYHPSNSYIEIDKDGNMTIRNNSNRTDVINANQNTHIGDVYNRNVESNRTSKVGSDEIEDIGSNRNVVVGGDETINIGSNRLLTIGSNQDVNVGSNHNISVGGNQTENITNTLTTNSTTHNDIASGVINLTAPSINISASGGSSACVCTGTTIETTASGSVSFTAPVINLN